MTQSNQWYREVTKYQWLVLTIASLGWIFDAFEGQLFNITRSNMLPELLEVPANDPLVNAWGERLLGVFLIGGTLGGWIFSSLADKWGRKPVMALTILCYSIFSGLTAWATEIWHVGVLRFLVAMGVGGEWAVGAALVAEIFPRHARERASVIFHASSVVGLWLAAAVGILVGTQWRTAYLIGVVPALLVLWVRAGVKEPEKWQAAKDLKTDRMGSFIDLLGDARWRRHALLGALLAMVGLATFWGVVIAGKDLAAKLLVELNDPNAQSKSIVAFGFIQTAGAGIGMLAFGPLSSRWGRRNTFAMMHVFALVLSLAVCWLPFYLRSYTCMLLLLPWFGFFAQGIHAGYALYFPELFPTHLRATGAGFCFNTGRLLAAPVLFWLSADLKEVLDLRLAVSCLAFLFLLGLVILPFLPETRGRDLPE